MAKKPTIKGNSSKGRSLHAQFLKTTKSVREASDVFEKQSKSLLDSISSAIIKEDQNLIEIEKNLKELDKKALDFKEKNDLLISLKKETEAKIKALNGLGDNAEISVNLTNKLLHEIEKTKSDSMDDLIVDNLSQLSEINKYLEHLSVDKEFDIDEILEHFVKIIDKEKLSKIEKRLQQLDNYFLNPSKRAGLFSNLTDILSTSLLGPLGKPVADVLQLSEKVEDKIDKVFKKTLNLEKENIENQKLYEELKRKIEESNLSDQDKENLLRRAAYEKERQEEIEIDRTQDYRAASLDLQRRALDKADSANFGIMQLAQFLTGGKFIKGLSTGVATLLGGKFLKSFLSSGTKLAAGKGVGTMLGGGTAAGSIKAGVGRAGSYGIAALGSWEIGTFIGEQINKHFGDEISDAVWWALEEAPAEVKEAYKKVKEEAATVILESASNSFTHMKDYYVDRHLESIAKLKNYFFSGEKTESNNLNKQVMSQLNSTLTLNRNISNKQINYRIPGVESFNRVQPVQSVPVGNTKNQEEKPKQVISSNLGKLSSNDIPMYTKDQKLLLLTLGATK